VSVSCPFLERDQIVGWIKKVKDKDEERGRIHSLYAVYDLEDWALGGYGCLNIPIPEGARKGSMRA
jgi:hypothetical protein